MRALVRCDSRRWILLALLTSWLFFGVGCFFPENLRQQRKWAEKMQVDFADFHLIILFRFVPTSFQQELHKDQVGFLHRNVDG